MMSGYGSPDPPRLERKRESETRMHQSQPEATPTTRVVSQREVRVRLNDARPTSNAVRNACFESSVSVLVTVRSLNVRSHFHVPVASAADVTEAWNPWQHVFLRAVATLRHPLRC